SSKKEFFITFLFISGITLFLINVYNYNSKILPEKIFVNTGNKEADEKIYRQAKLLLEKANSEKQDKDYFLNILNKKISNNGYIDQYWIRFGLNKRLEIHATLQQPIMLIEAKNNEIFVIGTKFKIIAKNTVTKNQTNILKLYLPNNKINWVSPEKQPKLAKKEELNNLNIPWLTKQTQLISLNSYIDKSKYKIDKIIWDQEQGFSLLLKRETHENKEQSENLSNYKLIKISLGNENLVEKMKRLNIVLSEIELKKMQPASIDLDYNEKASFKINLNNSNQTEI
ncbi:MAG: hypothetical protein K2X39_04420, partial [Silvanigrellaceae bacterium]|nr:hypothetical protein [Silvanigrellaceae bacterium]